MAYPVVSSSEGSFASEVCACKSWNSIISFCQRSHSQINQRPYSDQPSLAFTRSRPRDLHFLFNQVTHNLHLPLRRTKYKILEYWCHRFICFMSLDDRRPIHAQGWCHQTPHPLVVVWECKFYVVILFLENSVLKLVQQ